MVRRDETFFLLLPSSFSSGARFLSYIIILLQKESSSIGHIAINLYFLNRIAKSRIVSAISVSSPQQNTGDYQPEFCSI